jgi:hypothetical protein
MKWHDRAVSTQLIHLLFHSKACTKAQTRAYDSALDLPTTLAWDSDKKRHDTVQSVQTTQSSAAFVE